MKVLVIPLRCLFLLASIGAFTFSRNFPTVLSPVAVVTYIMSLFIRDYRYIMPNLQTPGDPDLLATILDRCSTVIFTIFVSAQTGNLMTCFCTVSVITSIASHWLGSILGQSEPQPRYFTRSRKEYPYLLQFITTNKYVRPLLQVLAELLFIGLFLDNQTKDSKSSKKSSSKDRRARFTSTMKGMGFFFTGLNLCLDAILGYQASLHLNLPNQSVLNTKK